MSYATFNNEDIPRVFAVDVSHELQGDRARTASGELRQDTLASPVKRVWTVQTQAMTNAEAQGMIGELLNPVAASFWVKGMDGTGGVQAMIVPDQCTVQTVAFGENGVWHNDGKRLTLVFEEV